jgi:hypothetical protein
MNINPTDLQAGPDEADAGIQSAPDPSVSAVPSSISSNQPTQQPTQPANQQPNRPQQQAQAQDLAHHYALGRAVKSMLGSLRGTTTQYAPNPKTGEIEATQVPAKPGRFFQNLLAGALIGGAAAEGPGGRGEGGFLGGFARGGNAVTQQMRQNDKAAFDRAQQQLKNQQEKAKQDDEHQKTMSETQLHAAMIAHYNIAIAGLTQDQHFRSQDRIDARNKSTEAYEKILRDQGGIAASFSVDGKRVDTMSGMEFMQQYAKDQSIMGSPSAGMQRHWIDTTSSSELTWGSDGQWHNASGAVSTPTTMLKAYDIPTSTMKTFRNYSGKEVNKLVGRRIVDDSATVSLSGESALSLANDGAKVDLEDARGEAARAKRANAATTNKAMVQIENRKASALAKAELSYATGLQKGTADKDELLSELTNAKQAAQDNYEESIIDLKGSDGVRHVTYPALKNSDSSSSNQSSSQSQSKPAAPPPKGDKKTVGGVPYVFNGVQYVKENLNAGK